MPLRASVVLIAVVLVLSPSSLFAQSQTTPPAAADLAGLWQAKQRFGPDIRGPLLLEHNGNTWRAEVNGFTVDATFADNVLRFTLPDERGGFRGFIAKKRDVITGHWNQGPRSAESPVTLTRVGKAELWRGSVDPLPTELTMYLKVDPAIGGTSRAFLKNPERNAGLLMNIASLERDGNTVRLLAKPRGEQPARVVSEGMIDEGGTLSLPLWGNTFAFQRVGDDQASDFYPRSHPGGGASYRYRVHIQLDDGWPVARASDAGVSADALEKFVRMIIDTPIDSLNAPEIHGVLIARHGTLVLEEYFHGEHRDKPHDTRSASKSVCTVLLGAMMQAGVPVSEKSFVYEVVNGGTFPDGLEPRKRALTVEHLLTMSSGLDADDNDDNSPGREDYVHWEQDNPDWWGLTLGLKMIREPGEKAVYASLQPNLAGNVMAKASGRPLVDSFHDLIAEPMQMKRYWVFTQPNGEAYFGGGWRFLPRDFMKFGQLMLNGGTWNGKRIVSADWVRKSTSPHTKIGIRRISEYGYLWWLIDYPYQGRTIRAYYAAGNGGQIMMAIPDLDMVCAFYGGNYSDNVIFQIQRRLVPEFVIPAVATK